MRLQAEAKQPFLQRARRAASAAISPRWTILPLSITSTVSPSSRAAWKFCSTSRMVAPRRLISAKHSISATTIAGARPLVGSSISSSLRGSTMARAIDSICFCPPDSAPARDSQKRLQRREESENPFQPGIVERPVARRQHQVFLHRQVGEHRHAFRHIADAEPGDIRRRAVSRCAARRARSRPAEACHRPMMVRSVVVLPAPLRPSSIVVWPSATAKIDALQDVIAPDMGVHAGEREKLGHAALFPGAMPR